MFKKAIMAFAAFSSVSAYAIPAASSDVIKATMRHPAFQTAFEEAGYFEKVSFETVSRYDYEECKNYSRSGSIVKVTFTKTYPEVSETVVLFTTDGNPMDLEPCGQ